MAKKRMNQTQQNEEETKENEDMDIQGQKGGQQSSEDMGDITGDVSNVEDYYQGTSEEDTI